MCKYIASNLGWLIPLVIAAILWGGGVSVAVSNYGSRLNNQEAHLSSVEDTTARIDERLKAIQADIADIKSRLAIHR